MIRSLSVNELDLCEELGAKFFKIRPVPGKFDFECFKRWWSFALSSNMGYILGSFKDDASERMTGSIGILTHPDIATGDLVAFEAFWITEDKSGIKLYREAEKEAVRRGAKKMTMSAFCVDEKTPRFYIKHGFTPVETHYEKWLEL